MVLSEFAYVYQSSRFKMNKMIDVIMIGVICWAVEVLGICREDRPCVAEHECSVVVSSNGKTEKNVYFTRHAESEWNAKKATYSFVKWGIQNFKWKRGEDATTYQSFKDAKLTPRGVAQVQSLANAIAAESECNRASLPKGSLTPTMQCSDLAVLRGDSFENTFVVASNLDRAIKTAQIAYDGIISKPGQTLGIMSFLQEISSGIDAQTDSLLCIVKPSVIPAADDTKYDLTGSVGDLNRGAAGAFGKSKEDRFKWFCQWAFNLPAKIQNIAIAGHSSWLQMFLIAKNPLGTSPLEKALFKDKLGNSSVINFTIQYDWVNKSCHVKHGSVSLVYGYVGKNPDKKKASGSSITPDTFDDDDETFGRKAIYEPGGLSEDFSFIETDRDTMHTIYPDDLDFSEFMDLPMEQKPI